MPSSFYWVNYLPLDSSRNFDFEEYNRGEMRKNNPGGSPPTATAKLPELGLPELIAIGVGGMIGGGIFSILGLAVDVSGHAAPLAFLIGSVIAVIAGYSYVCLALTYRSDGASFTYLEFAFPQKLWISGTVGWTVVIGYIGTLALYAFTFGAYATHLLGIEAHSWARPLCSTTSLLLFLGVNLIGTSATGKAEDFAVYIKIILLTVLAVVGLYSAETARMQPLFEHGVSSVFLGGALIFVAFEGFQLITNAVCETRNPTRNIPRAIYGSIAITALIYVAIAIVAVGNLDVDAIHAAKEYALAAVAAPVMGKLGVVLVDLAAILATSSAINATIFGASRLAFEMSKDGLAPKVFSFRTRNGVPAKSAVVITALAIGLASFGQLELIASFSSLTFLLVSIAVCAANLKLHESTKAARFPVILGILLMSTTVLLLLYYLAQNSVGALYFSLATYSSVGLAYAAFKRIQKRKQTTS